MCEKSDLWRGTLGFGGGGKGDSDPPILGETAKITLKICENILFSIPFH